MDKIDRLMAMFGGGSNETTWNILVPHFCGDCKGEDDKCEGCKTSDIISELENQLADSAFKHVKALAKEWIKNSVSV